LPRSNLLLVSTDVKNMLDISLVQSLADKAYHATRRLIVSLELAPGAVIDER
jgi:DNA-binding GntR family transcriptional regulator